MSSLHDGAPTDRPLPLFPSLSLLPQFLSRTPLTLLFSPSLSHSLSLFLPLSSDMDLSRAETFAEIRWKSGLSYKFRATARHARHANLFANSFVTSECPSGPRTRPYPAVLESSSNLLAVPSLAVQDISCPSYNRKSVFFGEIICNGKFRSRSRGFNEIGRPII